MRSGPPTVDIADHQLNNRGVTVAAALRHPGDRHAVPKPDRRDLQFGMGGFCKGIPQQWSRLMTLRLGYMKEHIYRQQVRENVIPLFSKVDGCRTEIIRAALVDAGNFSVQALKPTVRITGSGERIDLEAELASIQAKRAAEMSAAADAERAARMREAKRLDVETARRKRLAAERATQAATEAARLRRERYDAVERAKADRAKIDNYCSLLRLNTQNRKISDLTVKEVDHLGLCRALYGQ